MKNWILLLLPIIFSLETNTAQPLKELEKENVELIQKLQYQVVSIISCRSQKIPTSQEKKLIRTSVSGVICNKEGYILTIGEAVHKVENIHVELYTKEIFEAKVVGLDVFSNVGLLKIEAPSELLQPIVWGDSSSLKLGAFLFTIGNPYDLSHSLTIGNVAGLERFISPYLPDMAQMTNNINPGDPGGIVANSSGQFVGMMFTTLGPQMQSFQHFEETVEKLLEEFKSFEGKTYQDLVKVLKNMSISLQKIPKTPSFLGAQGINFFLPSNRIKFIVSELIAHGEVRRGKLGVTVVPLSFEMRTKSKLIQGVKVETVKENGPAFQAGIRKDDILVSCEQILIRSTTQIRTLIQESKPGTKVELGIIRDSKPKTIIVTIGE